MSEQEIHVPMEVRLTPPIAPGHPPYPPLRERLICAVATGAFYAYLDPPENDATPMEDIAVDIVEFADAILAAAQPQEPKP